MTPAAAFSTSMLAGDWSPPRLHHSPQSMSNGCVVLRQHLPLFTFHDDACLTTVLSALHLRRHHYRNACPMTASFNSASPPSTYSTFPQRARSSAFHLTTVRYVHLATATYRDICLLSTIHDDTRPTTVLPTTLPPPIHLSPRRRSNDPIFLRPSISSPSAATHFQRPRCRPSHLHRNCPACHRPATLPSAIPPPSPNLPPRHSSNDSAVINIPFSASPSPQPPHPP